jgi:hypothetical protein
MKNAAKCDTWCELQNPANHRVFERKLRPKSLDRGLVCLGVIHLVATLPPLSHESSSNGGKVWFPVHPCAVGPNRESLVTCLTASEGLLRLSCCPCELSDPRISFVSCRQMAFSFATPGQAGLPAEFKHINKRRKRNLQGFP